MANRKHLEILALGRAAWAQWREDHPRVVPDLERADLSGADLRELRLSGANLSEANLARANLLRADLARAKLLRANLTDALVAGADLGAAVLGWANLGRAKLWMANLAGANLIRADLTDTDVRRVNLTGAELAGASLRGARLHDTVLADVDLSRTEHLISCRHEGPSTVDHRTLDRSGPLPLSFLRGCGLPEALIESLATDRAGQRAYDPCFIRSDPADLALAQRVWADLQHEGVRCWRGPEDAAVGDVARDALRHDARMILILSKHAVGSTWIREEVTRVLDDEQRSHRTAIIPVRIDEAFTACSEAWAARIRAHHTVRDFSGWRDRIAYRGSLGRLLGDLRARSTVRRPVAVTPLSAMRARSRRVEKLPA